MFIQQRQFNSTSVARSDTAHDLTDAGQIIWRRQLNARLIQRPLTTVDQRINRSITADQNSVIKSN